MMCPPKTLRAHDLSTDAVRGQDPFDSGRSAPQSSQLFFREPLLRLGPSGERGRRDPSIRSRSRRVRPGFLGPRRGALDPKRGLPHEMGGAQRPLPRHRRQAPTPPVVGDLELTYEAMDLSAETGLTMFAYTAEPGSKSEQTLNLLGSWSATTDQPELTRTTDRA